MSTEINIPPGARARRVPLWPWLLMPAVVLAVFLILYNLRQRTPETQSATVPAATSPADASPP